MRMHDDRRQHGRVAVFFAALGGALVLMGTLGSGTAHAQYYGPVIWAEYARNPWDTTQGKLLVYDHGNKVAEWRAGSGKGNSDRYGENECYVNHGWIPAGYWRVGDYVANAGVEIHAFQLHGWYNDSYGNPQWSLNQSPTCHRSGLDLHIANSYHTSGCIGVSSADWGSVYFVMSVYRWTTGNHLLLWVH